MPETCNQLILVTDSTAVPAALSILRDSTTYTHAPLITSADVEELDHNYQFLKSVDIHRISAEPGALAAFVTSRLWDCDWFWACGESTELKPIRNHARSHLNLEKNHIQVFGYWRRSHSSTSLDIPRLRRVRDTVLSRKSLEELEAQLEEEL